MKIPGLRFWSRYSRQYLYEPKNSLTIGSFTISFLLVVFIGFGIKPEIENIYTRTKEIKTRQEI